MQVHTHKNREGPFEHSVQCLKHRTSDIRVTGIWVRNLQIHCWRCRAKRVAIRIQLSSSKSPGGSIPKRHTLEERGVHTCFRESHTQSWDTHGLSFRPVDQVEVGDKGSERPGGGSKSLPWENALYTVRHYTNVRFLVFEAINFSWNRYPQFPAS